jgi:hypothetical protein
LHVDGKEQARLRVRLGDWTKGRSVPIDNASTSMWHGKPGPGETQTVYWLSPSCPPVDWICGGCEAAKLGIPSGGSKMSDSRIRPVPVAVAPLRAPL